MSSGEAARERRLLLFSVWASAGFAVFSSIWGILSGSSMIVFDGLYSFASIGLSGLAVLALRFVRRGPDDRFPWGREAAGLLLSGTTAVVHKRIPVRFKPASGFASPPPPASAG